MPIFACIKRRKKQVEGCNVLLLLIEVYSYFPLFWKMRNYERIQYNRSSKKGDQPFQPSHNLRIGSILLNPLLSPLLSCCTQYSSFSAAFNHSSSKFVTSHTPFIGPQCPSQVYSIHPSLLELS